ncbi:hypothetical protein RCH11_000964 [Glaciihabitans sp. GrIS 2.15]|nr:hypothetical protein [Glaciihabitans sp. GrIS 2.15]
MVRVDLHSDDVKVLSVYGKESRERCERFCECDRRAAMEHSGWLCRTSGVVSSAAAATVLVLLLSVRVGVDTECG